MTTPVVVDANVLIRDVCANLRRSQVTALLGQAERQMARLLVSSRVVREVEGRMYRVARKETTEALALWHERYIPQLRVVDPGVPDASTTALLQSVAAADPDDVETAHVALLCAPCVVLTGDSDLLEHGFGAPGWLGGLRASGELSDFDSAAWIALHMSASVVEPLVSAGGHAARWVVRSPVATGVALGGIVFALTDGRPAVERLARVARVRGRNTLLGVAELAERLGEQRHQLQARLAPHVVAPAWNPPVEARLAARLAASRRPVPFSALATSEPEIAESAIRRVLHAHPAFESVRGHGWRVGRSALPARALDASI